MPPTITASYELQIYHLWIKAKLIAAILQNWSILIKKNHVFFPLKIIDKLKLEEKIIK